MEEYELQKNELLRLLHTANSEERKQHIQNALDALDKVAGNPSLYPAQASHIFHVPVETVTGANARPYSARRRSSIKLHVIPEELAKYRTAMATVEEENRGDAGNANKHLHVAKITATSCDPRFPPSYLLDAFPRPWLSTGLAPQTLSLHFETGFIVKKVQVYCTGVRELEVRSAPSHSPCQLRLSKPPQRTSVENMFVLEADEQQEPSGNESDSRDFVSPERDASPILNGATVNQLHFIVKSLSAEFCLIHRVRLATESSAF